MATHKHVRDKGLSVKFSADSNPDTVFRIMEETMPRKRVNFSVKETGNITTRILWADTKNVNLRQGKGHLFLNDGGNEYDLVYLLKGSHASEAEIKVSADGNELAKKKVKIPVSGKTSDSFEFTVP
ncbi:MAG: hypothetical protein AAF756_17890 [Pseudomonadota bacterium]